MGAPPAPDLTATCTGFILPYTLSDNTRNGTVNGLPITATFSDYTNTGTNAQTTLSCGVNIGTSANSFHLGGGSSSSSMKISFNRLVSNIKVYQIAAGLNETFTYTLRRNGTPVSPTIQLSSVGTCNTNFVVNGNTVNVPVGNASSGFGAIYNVGGVWFDEIVISTNGVLNGSVLQFCIGAAQ